MQKILAVLTINPDFTQFAVPELKVILSDLNIPIQTLFQQYAPLPHEHYLINHKNLKNFPNIILTVPNFQQHRAFFEKAANSAVMISKFVLLISSGNNYEELLQNKNEQLLNKQCRNWDEHIMCGFTSRNRVINRKQQIQKIHSVLGKMDVQGKIDMKTPTKRLQIVEQHKWYQNHHQVSSSQTLQKVYFGIELSSNKTNRLKWNSKFQLSNRIYLGPTSADNDLAFMMCNQAKVKQGSFVFDPFVGTAGLLIPPASKGAQVFGCDLDMRVLNGYSVGRINKKSDYYDVQKKLQVYTPKIYLNFDQYGLPHPNILRMDCTQCSFAQHVLFDAIISDPPYGIRAMSRSTQKKVVKQEKKEEQQQNIKQQKVQIQDKQQVQQIKALEKQVEEVKIEQKQLTNEESKLQAYKKVKKQNRKQRKQQRKNQMTQEQVNFKKDIAQKLSKQRIQNWQKFDKGVIENTERSVIFEGLLKVARKQLKPSGRLVFLYPIYEEQQFNGIDSLPKCQGFDVIDFSENELSKNNSRILVTLQKKL